VESIAADDFTEGTFDAVEIDLEYTAREVERARKEAREEVERERESERERSLENFPFELARLLRLNPIIRADIERMSRGKMTPEGRIVWSGKHKDLAFVAAALVICTGEQWGTVAEWFEWKGSAPKVNRLRNDASQINNRDTCPEASAPIAEMCKIWLESL
jgi:hypothetical protein